MAGVITEIAIECGVSEQAVRAWCRRNHVAKDAKGSFAISESQKTAIYQHYLGVERKQVSQPAKASCETCETTLIAMLQGELDRKSEQLAVKDKQIEELNARLAEVSSALVTAQQTAAAPLRSWQSSRHEPAVKQLRQPLPFRGAKHFHTAAPMGWRCESAFALLSHQKVTKRLFLAEIYDKIEDGRISGKGAILWELRFRV